MLKQKFEQSNMVVKQAREDADVLIVSTAISLSSNHDMVVINGEDIDLLALLTELTPASSENIYFRKPGRAKIAEKFYSSKSFQYKTSGKIKSCSIIERNSELNTIVGVFKNNNADANEIVEAGENFLLIWYGD